MPDFTIDFRGLNEATRAAMNRPGNFTKAKIAALKSTAWMVTRELRNHIEYGGSGWKPLHPITLALRKHKGVPESPLFWLGRFSRYRVIDMDGSLGIGLGRSNSGRPGQISDPWLDKVSRKHEFGARIPVTKRVRMKWISTKHKGIRTPKVRSGATLGGYWALRPETNFLIVPKREIYAPVFNKVQSTGPSWFQAKFWPAFAAYEAGSSPSKITSTFEDMRKIFG